MSNNQAVLTPIKEAKQANGVKWPEPEEEHVPVNSTTQWRWNILSTVCAKKKNTSYGSTEVNKAQKRMFFQINLQRLLYIISVQNKYAVSIYCHANMLKQDTDTCSCDWQHVTVEIIILHSERLMCFYIITWTLHYIAADIRYPAA